MSPDAQASKPLSGFKLTFGSQRPIPDSKSKDSKRPASDAGPNPKRRRSTIDQSEERSPVTKRDRDEASNPTTPGTIPNRRRSSDILKHHLPNPLPKVVADHKSADSLKFLHLFSEKLEFFQLRGNAIKNLKKLSATQSQAQHRSSGFSSAPDLLLMERKKCQEDIQRAEKHIAEFHERISPTLLSLLQDTFEIGDNRATPSRASEESVLSEAKVNVIQNTIKREIEAPFKKELAESQQSMKDAFESQMSKLKESLTEEYEQQLKSLRDTLTLEGEERAKSLKKTLTQEAEERVTSLRESIAKENEKRVAEIKLSFARKNMEKVAGLEKDLTEESKKNATLGREVADLKTRLDKTISDQRRMSESLIDKLLLDQKLQQLSKNQDEKLDELKVYVNELGNNTFLVQQLQQVKQFSDTQNEKLGKLEARLNQAGDNAPKIEDLAGQVRSLSTLIKEKVQQFSDTQNEKLGKLEARLNQEGDNAPKIEDLAGQVRSLSILIEEKVQYLSNSRDEKLGELEASLNKLVDKTYLALQLQHLSKSQGEKFSEIEARVNQAGDSAPRIEDFSKLEARVKLLADTSSRFGDLEEQVRSHSDLIEGKIQQQDDFALRLASLESTMSSIPAEGLGNIPTEVESIKECLQDLSLNHESKSVSKDLILKVIWPELERSSNTTKEMFKKVQSGLDKFMLKERKEREALDEKFVQLAVHLSDLQEGVIKITTDLSGLDVQLTGQLSDLQEGVSKITTDLSGLDERVNNQDHIYKIAQNQLEERVSTRVNSFMTDFQNAYAGIYIQLQALHKWQINFSTKGLYKDILTHINYTLPDGTVRQLNSLKQRVEIAETRISAFENNISNKRRKLPSGSGN